jgi:EAL domain-containing protein (putative c-di-GMP-specific phosphodiesterase class I)
MTLSYGASLERSEQRLAYILDDEPQICELIVHIVANEGFAARSFSDLPALELALTEATPDVIVLDLSLGHFDGIDAIRSLAASRYAGSILLMSGRHDAATISDVRGIGEHHGLVMLPFLQKPFRLEGFKERLAIVPSAKPAPRDAADLDGALRNHQLELWYQPKIDLKSHLVCGAEALIRLRHPERGILAPAAFLPPAGDPLHNPLADFVIRRALADWSFFSADQVNTRLAINMPISIFETPEFAGTLRRFLPGLVNFPGMIVELTEDEVISDPGLAREIAVQLKLYNIGIAIDDFGSGLWTLEQARTLPFAELKIDRSYVEGIARTHEKYSHCENIVVMAHQLGMIAVAEGVESLDDVQALKEMNCDVAQGWLLAHPMERAEFKKWAGQRIGPNAQ